MIAFSPPFSLISLSLQHTVLRYSNQLVNVSSFFFFFSLSLSFVYLTHSASFVFLPNVFPRHSPVLWDLNDLADVVPVIGFHANRVM